MAKLTHYKKSGQVAMVDITAKPATERTAVAHGFIHIARAALQKVGRLETPKGNPLEVARIAGIAAAKRTAEWIPLCHPLPLTHIDVTTRLCQNGVEITSRVTTTAQTGVAMAALVAVPALAGHHPCRWCRCPPQSHRSSTGLDYLRLQNAGP